MSSVFALAALGLLSLSFVAAHGQVGRVEVNGRSYDGPNVYYDGDGKNGGTPIRKGYRADGKAYLTYPDFNNDNNMACQEAGPAPGLIQVKPGDNFKWFWEGATHEFSDAGYPANTWVHPIGFTATYIASCNGDCRNANAADLGWQKIDITGMRPGQPNDHLKGVAASKSPEEHYRGSGIWALADLIENGSQYSSTIPNGLKNGQYILRSEIVALHNSRRPGESNSGPQNYVSCAQIEVVNGGNTALPYGTRAGSLYSQDGYLANYNINDPNQASNFETSKVGPAIWNGASAGNDNNNGGNNGGNDNNGGNNGGQQSQPPTTCKRSISIRGRVVTVRDLDTHTQTLHHQRHHVPF